MQKNKQIKLQITTFCHYCNVGKNISSINYLYIILVYIILDMILHFFKWNATWTDSSERHNNTKEIMTHFLYLFSFLVKFPLFNVGSRDSVLRQSGSEQTTQNYKDLFMFVLSKKSNALSSWVLLFFMALADDDTFMHNKH